jgi:hypothetical protein
MFEKGRRTREEVLERCSRSRHVGEEETEGGERGFE